MSGFGAFLESFAKNFFTSSDKVVAVLNKAGTEVPKTTLAMGQVYESGVVVAAGLAGCIGQSGLNLAADSAELAAVKDFITKIGQVSHYAATEYQTVIAAQPVAQAPSPTPLPTVMSAPPGVISNI